MHPATCTHLGAVCTEDLRAKEASQPSQAPCARSGCSIARAKTLTRRIPADFEARTNNKMHSCLKGWQSPKRPMKRQRNTRKTDLWCLKRQAATHALCESHELRVRTARPRRGIIPHNRPPRLHREGWGRFRKRVAAERRLHLVSAWPRHATAPHA